MAKDKDTTKKTDNSTQDKAKKKRRPMWVVWLTSPVLVVLIIIVFLFFYGDNSYLNHAANKEQIDELKAEIKLNVDSTAYYQRKAAALDSDPETLEKIAREQYGMKRDNEDVYITTIK